MIDRSSFTVGRTQEADLPILEPSVSRLHLSVELKNEQIWVTDKNSANGTTINGLAIEPGQMFQVKEGDVVKLGTLPEEFRFMAIPRPFELSTMESQKSAVMASMQELSKELEGKARAAAEKERRQAQIEVEQLISQAKKDAEILKTHALIDLQSRKSELEQQIEVLRKEAQTLASREKLEARREADLMIAEAQRRMQQDYKDANERLETQFREAHERAAKSLEDAQIEAETLVREAREEAARTRIQAADEARVVQQETLKKKNELVSGLQERLVREVQEKKAELIAQARVDAQREHDRFLKELQARHESVLVEVKANEERSAAIQAELARVEKDKSKTEAEIAAMKSDIADAKAILAKAEDMEARRLKAETELKEFVAEREKGLAKINDEFKALRERSTAEFEKKKADIAEELSKMEAEQKTMRDGIVVELEKRKVDLDNEINKLRLRALDNIKDLVRTEEQKYEQTRRLRAVELTQKLSDRLLPKLGLWMQDQDGAPLRLKADVESVVNETILKEESSIQNLSISKTLPKVSQEVRDKRVLKFIGFGSAITVLLIAVFGTQLLHFFEGLQKDSYAAKLIEQRKLQSVYTPTQDDDFRDTYTDNVLYMKGYYDTKTDQNYIDKWTLKLNDIGYLRSMGLAEEDIVKFIAKEANLVHRLGALRDSIDAVYLTEGLDRMHKAEDEDVVEIKKVLKGDDNYAKIRAVERDFLKDYMKKK